jgi:hypothetical protein
LPPVRSANIDQWGDLVFVRAVRFVDVSAERMDGLLAQIEASDGPPPGIPISAVQVLFDEDQGTAVVLQIFDSAEDMQVGAEVFAAMDASETPGTRASVDMCELKLEMTAPA